VIVVKVATTVVVMVVLNSHHHYNNVEAVVLPEPEQIFHSVRSVHFAKILTSHVPTTQTIVLLILFNRGLVHLLVCVYTHTYILIIYDLI
jgi:hypothetical protein